MWQYKRIGYQFHLLRDMEAQLNKDGEDGWEIIYYTETKPVKLADKYSSSVLYKKYVNC